MSVCPVCASPNSSQRFVSRDENRAISAVDFEHRQCAQCGTIFIANPPEDLGAHYGEDYHAMPSLDRLRRIAAKNSSKIDLVARFARGKRLLEIGSSFGLFALQAKTAGFDVQSIEMNAECCKFLNAQVGVRATCSDDPIGVLEGMTNQDVIVMWHVIEHVPNVAALVEHCAAALAPGGILVLGTPNPDAFQFRIMGRHWPHVDAPRHLQLIPVGAMEALGARHGLKVEYLTTDDRDARHWNLFGWQWLARNQVRGKWLKRVAHAVGTAAGIAMIPLDRRGGQGSAYTMVLRKAAA